MAPMLNGKPAAAGRAPAPGAQAAAGALTRERRAYRPVLAPRARRPRSERAAAQALIRSLVPEALPRVAGVDIAACYVPRDGDVGGDWYDVFTLPSGELGAAIGDVAGAGLTAAILMGRIRSSLRAYALDTTNPAEVLRRLDRKVQHFEPGALATVLYAVFDPARGQLRLSSAGHLPPVIAAPGQAAALADIATDLLIGVSADAVRHATTVALRPGTVLCFYTDGLVERRGASLDDGLARLCQAISGGPAEAVCARAMATLAGDVRCADDTALLVLRCG
jgi:serine phosphatase RsbU (regulator of sigma subunit)